MLIKSASVIWYVVLSAVGLFLTWINFYVFFFAPHVYSGRATPADQFVVSSVADGGGLWHYHVGQALTTASTLKLIDYQRDSLPAVSSHLRM